MQQPPGGWAGGAASQDRTHLLPALPVSWLRAVLSGPVSVQLPRKQGGRGERTGSLWAVQGTGEAGILSLGVTFLTGSDLALVSSPLETRVPSVTVLRSCGAGHHGPSVVIALVEGVDNSQFPQTALFPELGN